MSKSIISKNISDNQVQIFKQNGWKLRVINKNDELWFVASEVCKNLKHTNTTVAVNMVEDDERSKLKLGRQGEVNIINESGLYFLIMRSKLPEAKKFRKWVTSEVLPSIRKKGTYSTQLQQIPQSLSAALQLAADQAKQIEEQQPLVDFAKTVEGTDNLIGVGDYAKINGSYGRNTLFKRLREDKILQKNNLPFQRYLKQGYFEVKETIKIPGDILIKTTYITGKGQLWLDKKIGEYLNGDQND